MKRIADYQGTLLNHIETLYRPGERAMAIALAEALGCVISDTGFSGRSTESFLAVHPNPDDRNMESNAFYMSPMGPEQQALEAQLARLCEEDEGLRASLATYRALARTAPFGVPHFALRYTGVAAVRAVVDALGRLSPALSGRLDVRVFWPEDKDIAEGRLVQAFVHQDVIVSGSFLYGQLIELQSPAV